MSEELQYRVKSEGLVSLGAVDLYLFHSVPTEQCLGRMLFLGGSNFDLRIKRAFRSSELIKHFEFVTYEPRGLSRSSLPNGDWTMSDYANDAQQVMQYLGWSSALVVGESFGGMTALQLALDFPDRVQAFVTTSATAGGVGGQSVDLLPLLSLELSDFSRQMLLQQDIRNRQLEHEDPSAFVRKLEQRMSEDQRFFEVSGASGGYARLLRARQMHDVWDKLDEIQCPALVMAGEYDLQAPVASQKRLSENLTQAQFFILPSGHGLLFASKESQVKILDWIQASQLAH